MKIGHNFNAGDIVSWPDPEDGSPVVDKITAIHIEMYEPGGASYAVMDAGHDIELGSISPATQEEKIQYYKDQLEVVEESYKLQSDKILAHIKALNQMKYERKTGRTYYRIKENAIYSETDEGTIYNSLDFETGNYFLVSEIAARELRHRQFEQRVAVAILMREPDLKALKGRQNYCIQVNMDENNNVWFVTTKSSNFSHRSWRATSEEILNQVASQFGLENFSAWKRGEL